MGCNETNKWRKEIVKSNNLSLFTISRNPIEPSLQNPKTNYCQDYEVQESLPLTQSQIMLLKEALINQKNFSKEDLKRCPFLPIYAIEIDSSLTAIIGTQPCSRIQFKSNTNEKVVIMDLIKDNEIEKILSQIEKE